ncbi:MAG TPA: tRNA (cytidine(34)-2'-O)-methyltransferase [Steroidobacteraceae bacterium]|nr:tRNA (cytidine(34)-2'-O)-methyltransferase [Steroidobacteraceae bacterium]
MFHVILYQPEIPPNTGNIIRLCANSGCQLHLVGPLGFDMDRRSVRRAGLDYSELAQVHTHRTLEECLQRLSPPRLFAVETGAGGNYAQARYSAGDALLFGPETRGLPPAVMERIPASQHVSIPMQPGNRSLNLSNAVAVVVYEAWRQCGFSQHGFRSQPPPA